MSHHQNLNLTVQLSLLDIAKESESLVIDASDIKDEIIWYNQNFAAVSDMSFEDNNQVTEYVGLLMNHYYEQANYILENISIEYKFLGSDLDISTTKIMLLYKQYKQTLEKAKSSIKDKNKSENTIELNSHQLKLQVIRENLIIAIISELEYSNSLIRNFALNFLLQSSLDKLKYSLTINLAAILSCKLLDISKEENSYLTLTIYSATNLTENPVMHAYKFFLIREFLDTKLDLWTLTSDFKVDVYHSEHYLASLKSELLTSILTNINLCIMDLKLYMPNFNFYDTKDKENVLDLFKIKVPNVEVGHTIKIIEVTKPDKSKLVLLLNQSVYYMVPEYLAKVIYPYIREEYVTSSINLSKAAQRCQKGNSFYIKITSS